MRHSFNGDYDYDVALNKAIAQTQGIHVVRLECNDRDGWDLVKADGKSLQNGCAKTEESAWESFCPNYKSQAQDVAEWAAKFGFNILIQILDDYRFWVEVNVDGLVFADDGSTPDEAAHAAFARMRKALRPVSAATSVTFIPTEGLKMGVRGDVTITAPEGALEPLKEAGKHKYQVNITKLS